MSMPFPAGTLDIPDQAVAENLLTPTNATAEKLLARFETAKNNIFQLDLPTNISADSLQTAIGIGLLRMREGNFPEAIQALRIVEGHIDSLTAGMADPLPVANSASLFPATD